MHHESRLLPIDDDGGFVAATHFARHVVGGEDPRETAQVRFAIGRADAPAALRDITPLCTLPRAASDEEAEYQRAMAAGQGELARSGRYGAAMAANYAHNELAMAHAARLAERDTVFAPRRVAAARNGTLLLGFECRSPVDPGAGREVLRLVDARAGSLLLSASSSAFRHSHLLALAFDGRSALLQSMGPKGLAIVERRLVDGLPELAQLPGNMASHYAAVRGGWIGFIGERASVFAAGSAQPQREFALPAGAIGWGAAVTSDGRLVALATDAGAVWLVDTHGGKPRRFHPYRGLARGAQRTVALSDDGA